MERTVIFNALQSSLNGGIGRYSYELSRNIYLKNKINFKIIIRSQDKQLFRFAKSNDLIIIDNIVNSKDRNYYEQFVLPKFIRENYPEAIVHYPDSMGPILLKNKSIITIHDMGFKSIKSAYTYKTRLWKVLTTNLSVNKCSKIIAITDFTKQEIYKYYPKVNKNKIKVVYNGFNNFSNEQINMDNISNNIRNVIRNPYILTVSTISPRKNIDGLIKAFNLIKNDIKYDLVVCGSNGWKYEEVYKTVNKFKLDNRVKFTGRTTDDELKLLYKNTRLFIYPSFYEGFGLPPLEAMSYGVPCIVSNCTSLPEVVGNSAILIDPNDLNTMADKMIYILEDEESRRNLANSGYKNIERFSWQQCADSMIHVYEDIMNI